MLFLRKIPIFENLTEKELHSVAQITQQQRCPAHTRLFQQGDVGTNFYIIQSGSIKIYQLHGEREKIITVFHSGDCFGEISLLDGKPRSASAATLEDTVLFNIPATPFLDLMRTNFDINVKIISQLCKRLRDTNQHVADLVFLDAQTKVLKTLIHLANEHGNRATNVVSIDMRMPAREIGKMNGLPESTVEFVLGVLERKDLLSLQAGKIFIKLANLGKPSNF